MSAIVEPAAPPSARRKGTLLIVDDEEGPRQALKLVFKGNYDLLLAEDGPSAIELAKANAIDVAVMDIRMPGMSGLEVLGRLRESHPDMEVIMFTAYETTETMREALRLQACDYINKPFDLGTIRKAVDRAMQLRLRKGNAGGQDEKIQQLLIELQVEAKNAQAHKDIYASILHDINGPLTVVSGFVQLLNARLASSGPLAPDDLGFVKERLAVIERQIANCIEIQRRYLGFLRRQGSEQARTGVNQLLKDLEYLVRVHPSRQEHGFQITPLAHEAAVKINGTDVIQMLLNLAVNAFQCTPEPHSVEIGGEVLAAGLDPAQFKDGPNDRFLNVEHMSDTAPVVKLWVRDTGPGIPAEVLPKIFQSYFTTKGHGQGTGLGLTIVQRLVKDAHGALHVHTEPGAGTTFAIYLPGVPPPQ